MSSKYEQLYDGDWWLVKRKGMKLMCCDCGLVHTLDFKITNNRISVRVFRDNRATALARRRARREKPKKE